MAPPITRALDVDLVIQSVDPMAFDAATVVEHFRARLAKRFGKKGIVVRWVQGGVAVTGVPFVMHLETGNQFMRWLLPFSAPAVCTVLISGTRVQGRGTAHFGFFGGTAEGMLKVAADRAAARLVGQLVALPEGALVNV